MKTTSGHCLCRAIAFSFEGAPNWTLHCHCESCRRATSSPMATWVSVPRNASSARADALEAGSIGAVTDALVQAGASVRGSALVGSHATRYRVDSASKT